MNKKIKKILVSASILLILPIVSIGAVRADEKNTQLTLEKAINIGLKNSPSVQQAQISIEKCENILNDTIKIVGDLEEYRKFREDMNNVDHYYLDYAKEITVATAIAQAELGVNIAKSTMEDSKRGTILNIEKSYYEVEKSQHNLVNAKKALQRTDEANKQVKVKYKSGMASKNDLTLSEMDLSNAENAVNIAEYSLQSSLIGLSNVLGYNVEEGYSLNIDTSFKAFDRSREKELIDYAVENAPTLYRAIQERVIGEDTVKVANSAPNAKNEDRRDAELELKIKKLNETNAKNNVVTNVRQALLSLYTTEAAYSTAENNLKTTSANYKMISELYKTGLKTYLEVQTAELALNQAESALNKALFDNRLALSNLNLVTSGGIDNDK